MSKANLRTIRKIERILGRKLKPDKFFDELPEKIKREFIFQNVLEDAKEREIINSINNLKTSFPDLTLPTFKYCGAGTNIIKNINEDVRPKNKVDNACRTHDLEFLLAQNPKDVREADEKLLNAIKNVKGVEASAVRTAIKSKIKLEDLGTLNPMKFINKLQMTKEQESNVIERLEEVMDRTPFNILGEEPRREFQELLSQFSLRRFGKQEEKDEEDDILKERFGVEVPDKGEIRKRILEGEFGKNIEDEIKRLKSKKMFKRMGLTKEQIEKFDKIIPNTLKNIQKQNLLQIDDKIDIIKLDGLNKDERKLALIINKMLNNTDRLYISESLAIDILLNRIVYEANGINAREISNKFYDRFIDNFLTDVEKGDKEFLKDLLLIDKITGIKELKRLYNIVVGDNERLQQDYVNTFRM